MWKITLNKKRAVDCKWHDSINRRLAVSFTAKEYSFQCTASDDLHTDKNIKAMHNRFKVDNINYIVQSIAETKKKKLYLLRS